MSFSVYANVQFDRQQEIQRGITQYFCPTYRGVEEEEQYDEDGNIYQQAAHQNPNAPINKECANDWSYYLVSLPTASQSDEESQKNLDENESWVNTTLAIDLLFLLTSYLFMFVASGQLKLT